ncbi:MAG: hypothetical protein ACJASQ_002639 [Crocinitomicaceae bacterium]|jgi:hypothetical protein
MKKSILLSALLAVILLMGSCKKESVKPLGSITTETRSLTGFDALDVSDAIDVEVTFDPNVESVVVEANSNLHQYILTDVVSGRLKVRIKNNVRIKSGATIKIYVSTTFLDAVGISGASRVEFTNELITSFLDLDISGASTFQGGMTVTDFDADASGASDIEIWGSSNTSKMDLSGASKITDEDFVMNDLDIDLSGASRATLTVNGVINISASGASSLDYYGTGLIDNLESSGGSNINKH